MVRKLDKKRAVLIILLLATCFSLVAKPVLAEYNLDIHAELNSSGDGMTVSWKYKGGLENWPTGTLHLYYVAQGQRGTGEGGWLDFKRSNNGETAWREVPLGEYAKAKSGQVNISFPEDLLSAMKEAGKGDNPVPAVRVRVRLVDEGFGIDSKWEAFTSPFAPWIEPGQPGSTSGTIPGSGKQSYTPTAFEKIFVVLFQGLSKGLELLGFKSIDQLVFNQGGNYTETWPFEADTFENLMTWYWYMAYLGLGLAAVGLLMNGYRLVWHAYNPVTRSRAVGNLPRWLWVCALILVMPYIFRFVLFLNNLLVAGALGISQTVGQGGDISKMLAALFAVDSSGMVTGLVDAILVFAMLLLQVYFNFVYTIRGFILGALLIFAPITAWLWAANNSEESLTIWFGELISQTFLQFGHALTLLMFFTVFMAAQGEMSMWHKLFMMIAVIPCSELVRNSFMAGLKHVGIPNHRLGLGGLIALTGVAAALGKGGIIKGFGGLAAAGAGPGGSPVGGLFPVPPKPVPYPQAVTQAMQQANVVAARVGGIAGTVGKTVGGTVGALSSLPLAGISAAAPLVGSAVGGAAGGRMLGQPATAFARGRAFSQAFDASVNAFRDHYYKTQGTALSYGEAVKEIALSRAGFVDSNLSQVLGPNEARIGARAMQASAYLSPGSIKNPQEAFSNGARAALPATSTGAKIDRYMRSKEPSRIREARRYHRLSQQLQQQAEQQQNLVLLGDAARAWKKADRLDSLRWH